MKTTPIAEEAVQHHVTGGGIVVLCIIVHCRNRFEFDLFT